jgi:hypothetical protein
MGIGRKRRPSITKVANVLCVVTFLAAAMDFHHINPAEKRGYGTGH